MDLNSSLAPEEKREAERNPQRGAESNINQKEGKRSSSLNGHLMINLPILSGGGGRKGTAGALLL